MGEVSSIILRDVKDFITHFELPEDLYSAPLSSEDWTVRGEDGGLRHSQEWIWTLVWQIVLQKADWHRGLWVLRGNKVVHQLLLSVCWAVMLCDVLQSWCNSSQTEFSAFMSKKIVKLCRYCFGHVVLGIQAGSHTDNTLGGPTPHFRLKFETICQIWLIRPKDRFFPLCQCN